MFHVFFFTNLLIKASDLSNKQEIFRVFRFVSVNIYLAAQNGRDALSSYSDGKKKKHDNDSGPDELLPDCSKTPKLHKLILG